VNEPEQNRIPSGPSEEEIAICALMIWEQEGRPEGQDKVHWEQAEEQLTASYAHNRWVPVPALDELQGPEGDGAE